MKTRPAFLVIDTNGLRPTIARVRQSWPPLEPGEIVVRVTIEIPDDLRPKLHEVVIDNPAMAAIGVEPEEVPQ